MKLTAYIFILISFVLLQSCATTDPNVAQEKKEIEYAKGTIKEQPKWFEKLKSDKKILYAKGTAVSKDMQLSIDKATLNARTSLADQLNGHISANMKQFVKESGIDEDTEMYSEVEKVVKSSVKETSTIGYREYKSETVASGSKYRTYYVLEYPFGKANKILVSQIKNSALLEGSLQASEAYKELEKEIQGSN